MNGDKAEKQSRDPISLSALEELIARVIDINFSSQASEQATREMAVNPIIAALGWDTFNPGEVAREYPVLGGKVDYCLRESDQDLVLIEAKRVDTDLGEHQEQLLRYAFNAGVPLAALTDGLLWWLYLPMAADTNWEQRRFFRIDFREQGAANAAADIHRFLNRQGVTGGTSQEEAQLEFESQKRDRRVSAALQEAWWRILGDPQGLLRDLLAETVHEISGDVPDPGVIAEFLEEISGSENTQAEAPPKSPRRRARRTLEHEPVRPLSKECSPTERGSRPERKQRFRFSMVSIKVGETLTSRWDDEARCTVLSDSRVKFKDKEMSLSAAALQVVRDRGKNWKAVSGPESWLYNGEPLAALRERLFTEGLS